MADLKISQLNSIVTVVPATDVLPVVQGGTTLKITPKQILESGSPAVLASATITGAATVGTTLGVTGVSTLASVGVTGAATVGTTLLVGTNATLTNGNVIIGTSGKGIDFSATANSSGTMTSELLNDYEEGTWVPVLGGDGGTSGQTYSLQVGRYTKVGRQVVCSFEATLTAVGTVTGNAIISGLPFSSVSTSFNTDGGTTTIGFANNLATNQIFITGYLNGAGAYSFITGIAAAGTAISNITATNIFGNTTRLSGTITYTAS